MVGLPTAERLSTRGLFGARDRGGLRFAGVRQLTGERTRPLRLGALVLRRRGVLPSGAPSSNFFYVLSGDFGRGARIELAGVRPSPKDSLALVEPYSRDRSSSLISRRARRWV